MPFVEIKPRALTLMKVLAGDYADHYIDETLLPCLHKETGSSEATVDSVREALADSYTCLQAVYGHYAFARRGKDRAELAGQAVEALHRTCRPEAFAQFLQLPHADSLWQTFELVCRERARKPMEQLNRGIIAGMAELAQEIYRLDPKSSISSWIVQSLRGTSRLEPEFLRIVDIRGVGPKMTSVLLRDVVFLHGLEEACDPVDRLYVQPIDKWVRRIAPYVVDEPGIERAADWILAGKLAKYTRKAGISGIRFSMGTSAFGAVTPSSPQGFDEAVSRLLA